MPTFNSVVLREHKMHENFQLNPRNGSTGTLNETVYTTASGLHVYNLLQAEAQTTTIEFDF